MAAPTQARVCEYFNYEPDTGNLILKLRDRSEFKTNAHYGQHLARVGKPAGGIDSEGYVKVCIDGKYYGAHRVIWLAVTGEWPVYPRDEIDHENRKRDDNRWVNLRKGTKSDNQRNAGMRLRNSSGVHGVNWKARGPDKGRWVARIWNGPKHVYLGQFKTVHEAKIARKAAERALGFSPAESVSPHCVRRCASLKRLEAIQGVEEVRA